MNTKSLKSDLGISQDSLLDGNSVVYLEALYESYLKDPESLTPAWQSYFSDLTDENSTTEAFHSDIRSHFKKLASNKKQHQCPFTLPRNDFHISYFDVSKLTLGASQCS